jgi:hypothetical protein
MLLPTAVGEIALMCCGVEEVRCSSLDSQERPCP